MTNDFTTRPAGEHEAQLTKRLGEVIRDRDRYKAALRAVKTGYYHSTLLGSRGQFIKWLEEAHGIKPEDL